MRLSITHVFGAHSGRSDVPSNRPAPSSYPPVHFIPTLHRSRLHSSRLPATPLTALPISRRTTIILASAGIICTGAGIATGWLALGGASAGFDREILTGLRAPGDLARGIGPSGTPQLVWLVSFLGAHAVLALFTLIVAARIYARGHRRLAAITISGVAGAMVLSAALKFAILRPRPDVTPHLGGFAGSSFPSSHAMLSAAVYGVLALSLAQMAPSQAHRNLLYGMAAIAAIVIGMSRLYLGVHWPTDVLAGWCFGVAWVALYAALLPTMLHRDHAPPQHAG